MYNGHPRIFLGGRGCTFAPVRTRVLGAVVALSSLGLEGPLGHFYPRIIWGGGGGGVGHFYPWVSMGRGGTFTPGSWGPVGALLSPGLGGHVKCSLLK